MQPKLDDSATSVVNDLNREIAVVRNVVKRRGREIPGVIAVPGAGDASRAVVCRTRHHHDFVPGKLRRIKPARWCKRHGRGRGWAHTEISDSVVNSNVAVFV